MGVRVRTSRCWPTIVVMLVAGTLVPARATALAAHVVGHSASRARTSPHSSRDASTNPPGLVHWWKGDGNANDSVGTADGTLVGGGYASGESGEAFNLDGNDDYVDIPSSAMSNITGDISVSAWMDPSSESFSCGPTGPKCSDVILSQYDTDTKQTSFLLDITQGGVIEWFVVGPSCDSSPNNTPQHENDLRAVQTTTSIPLNQWTHVVATFDAATQAMHVLVNGSDVPVTYQKNGSGTVETLCRATTPVRIGSVWGGPPPGELSDFFPGLIDDVQLYNRDISPGAGRTFTTIDPPTRTDATAYDINNDGTVVGQFTGAFGTIGFVRTADGHFHIVDRYDAVSISVNGINDHGAIVGHYVKRVNGKPKTFAFVQKAPGAAMTTLALPKGSTDMQANKIDNAGNIVGSFVDPNGITRGYFRPTGGASLIRINCTANAGATAKYTVALGIGNDGTVVGTFSDSIDSANGRSHGFSWNRTTRTCTQIDSPGAVATQIWDRANGVIVGTYVPAGGVATGFVGPTSGPFATVVYPGSARSSILGTNDAGDVVGVYNLGDNSGDHAFLSNP